MRSSSLTGRPLTKATPPSVRCQSRVKVSRSSGETKTSRGVGARSRIVPSTSSRKANCLRSEGSEGMEVDITVIRKWVPLRAGPRPSACKLVEDGAIGTDTTTHRFTERSEQKKRHARVIAIVIGNLQAVKNWLQSRVIYVRI